MFLYAVTIFLSAFLLFQVQPMIGKYILPWFGGSPAVWTTCLLFFQLALLGGYAYSHLVVSRFRPREQGWLHVALLVLALFTLPVIPSPAFKPSPADNPVWRILWLLSATVGVPYLLLSTTGPLLQGWFSRTHAGRSPYRLYALSNLGSLLALLSYPLVFERLLRRDAQAWQWSAGFVVFAVLCALLAMNFAGRYSEADAAAASRGDEAPPPSVGLILVWLALAACASLLLLAVTNRLCQDVAVVPFLWVLPLALYLLSFILCFEHERVYSRVIWAPVLMIALVGISVVMVRGVGVKLMVQVPVYLGALFVICMVCHGELVHLKPHPRHLTLFYLMVSAGGALGGVFCALVAPRIFTSFYELHTGLLLVTLLVMGLALRDFLARNRAEAGAPLDGSGLVYSLFAGTSLLLGLGLLIFLLHKDIAENEDSVLDARRNFYGVLRVIETDKDQPQEDRLVLAHGSTWHGFQYRARDKRMLATSYYSHTSGIGLALDWHPKRMSQANPLDHGIPALGGGDSMRIGMVGLGTGSVSVYARMGDTLRFYEINPAVVELNRKHFTYLADARDRGADVGINLGDARLVMERQLAEGRPQQFDVLAIDAFSSDAIPVHLLTEECFRMYWKHLKSDGILAVHITNRYLNLAPVVKELADRAGYPSLIIDDDRNETMGVYPTDWVLVTRNSAFLATPQVKKSATPWSQRDDVPVLWTDDYSSLWAVLSFHGAR